MADWIVAVRELGLTALLVGGCVWLAYHVPRWVQDWRDERQKDRALRTELLAMLVKMHNETIAMILGVRREGEP